MFLLVCLFACFGLLWLALLCFALLWVGLVVSLFLCLPACLSVLSVFLFVCLSVCLAACLSVCLSRSFFFLPICLADCLSVCLSVYLPTYLSTYIPIYLHIYLSIYRSIDLSTYLPTYYLSIYPSILLSTHTTQFRSPTQRLCSQMSSEADIRSQNGLVMQLFCVSTVGSLHCFCKVAMHACHACVSVRHMLKLFALRHSLPMSPVLRSYACTDVSVHVHNLLYSSLFVQLYKLQCT